MNSIYSDEELVAMARSGKNAFADLYARYYPKIKRYIGYKLPYSDPEDKEDIVQDVFMKAWKGLDSFNTSQRFSPWIYRIAHNEMANAVKAKLSKRNQSLEELQEDSHFDIPSTDYADTRIKRLLLRENINRILLKLDNKYRIPLIMMHVHGMSHKEISKELSLSITTVGGRIQRAKQKFLALTQS